MSESCLKLNYNKSGCNTGDYFERVVRKMNALITKCFNRYSYKIKWNKILELCILKFFK
jgi:hypothetical protein